MLSKKTKGLFVEVTGFSCHVAAVTGMVPPFTIESVHEFSRQDPEKLVSFLGGESSTRRNRYINAHCGVVPESRFFRLHTLESMAKAKDPEYFFQLLEEQFRVDSRSARFSVLSAQSGMPFDASKPLGSQKELLFCGAEAKELATFQDSLVESGIYPQSLQLSTLSSIAALKYYLQGKAIDAPVLLIEMARDSANLFILTREKIDLCRPVNFGFDAVLPVIQKELGLKDEASARNLFFSNTFDFREIGPRLLARFLKELNSSTGFYEVQTGQTIPFLYMTSLPETLEWIPEVIANELEIGLLDIDWEGWAADLGISFGDACSVADFGPSRFGLFSLFLNFQKLKDGSREEN